MRPPSYSYRPLALALLLLAACGAPREREDRSWNPPPSAPRQTSAPADPLSADGPRLEARLARALETNASLRAARARLAAARERGDQASAWPEPVLNARVFLEEVQTRTGPQEFALGISQRIPWSGARAIEGELADARAAVDRARLDEAALDVTLSLMELWCELHLAERSIRIVEEHAGLLLRLEEVVRTRYAAGETSYAELLRAEVERERNRDRLLRLEDGRRPLAARWNALVNDPAGDPVPWPEELPARPAGFELPATPALLERALAKNPTIRAAELGIEVARQHQRLAEREGRPDVTVGIEWISTGDAVGNGVTGSGDDPVVASLSVPLPLRAPRYRAAEREARSEVRAAMEELSEVRARLSAQLEVAAFETRDAERREELYGATLLPKARQALDATATSYRAGSASFLDLVDAERVALDLELARLQARADHARALAQVERLLGAPLEALVAAE